MNEIKSYCDIGIVNQIFEAEISLVVWNKIAEQIDKLEKLDDPSKKLFSYIQKSSGTNYILNTAKIFDTPNKKYPTRCLLSFFNLIDKNNNFPKIENKTGLIRILERYNCSSNLIFTVNNIDSTIFAREFCIYYRQKYNGDEIQNAIKEVRVTRDKYIAHNEHLRIHGRVEIKTIRMLLDFATEIISVFSFAFFNSIWTIQQNAKSDAYFIQRSIDKLVEK